MNLNDLAQRAIQLHEGIEPGDVRVECSLERDLWPVSADPTQLSQVVTTLYTRALEAMGGHGAIMLTTRNLSLRREDSLSSFGDAIRPGRYAYLACEYTLPDAAAPPAPRAEDFRPVFSTRFQNQAAGLGVLYMIVKNHQGRIFLDAESGSPHGLFRLYIPAEEVAAPAPSPEPALAAAGTDPETQLPTGSETVLVVDDEMVVLRVTQAILERLGYKVIPAHDGHEAVDIVGLYDGPIDLAILDLGMPTMSGQEAFPILKRARPGMKIIISSGYDKDDVAQDLLRAGASALIQKPFPISLFAPKVREVLDRPAQP